MLKVLPPACRSMGGWGSAMVRLIGKAIRKAPVNTVLI
jgi:hypothetical protein